MKALIKEKWIAALAGITGVVVLLSFFSDQPQLTSFRQGIIHWGMLVVAFLLIFAIVEFILARLRGIGERSGSLTFNFVTFAVFLGVVIYGFSVRDNPAQFESAVFSVQAAVESSLAGLICIAMVYGIYRTAHKRSSILKTSFLLSALFFLIYFSGIFSFFRLPEWALEAIELIRTLPVGGTYGLLIGLAIGGLVTGIRVLFLGDHPYKGRDQ